MNNPANQLITKKEVEDILNHFGNIGHNSTRLEINQLDHYQCAFVHETYFQAVQTMTQTKGSFISGIHFDYIPMESSQRLEFLGDNVLKAVLGRYLMERFGSEREGFLTRLKIKIENKDALYKIAVKLGFKKFLLLSLETENVTLLDIDRGRNTPSYYEDAFESFLGSILMDFGEHGYVYADRFFRGVLENVIDFADLISTNDNFKDSLQRFFQSNRWDTPSYKELKEPGESVPVYRQVFTSVLFVTVQQYETLDKASQKRISGYT
jgi:dsRNA-specific ribonuclease